MRMEGAQPFLIASLIVFAVAALFCAGLGEVTWAGALILQSGNGLISNALVSFAQQVERIIQGVNVTPDVRGLCSAP